MRAIAAVAADIQQVESERDRLTEQADALREASDPGKIEKRLRLMAGSAKLQQRLDALQAEFGETMLVGVDSGAFGTESGDGTAPSPYPIGGASSGLRRSYDSPAPSWGEQFVESRASRALLDLGTVPVSVPLAAEPITDARQARWVYELIPGVTAPNGTFAYLRQTARTNNAAIVEPGELKPESVYTLERIDDRTKVFAHVSEPIDRFDLEDAAILRAFLDSEMVYGLNRALDDHVVATISGLADVVPEEVNLLSIRRAITGLQLLDMSPSAIVLSPTAWETVETEANAAFAGTGRDEGTDAMSQRLYSVPVTVTNSIADDVALIGDFRGSAKVYRTGDARISLHDSQPRDVSGTLYADYRLNQLVVRAELRAEVAVTRPIGFTLLSLGS